VREIAWQRNSKSRSNSSRGYEYYYRVEDSPVVFEHGQTQKEEDDRDPGKAESYDEEQSAGVVHLLTDD
jgi:hypothetical protein